MASRVNFVNVQVGYEVSLTVGTNETGGFDLAGGSGFSMVVRGE